MRKLKCLCRALLYCSELAIFRHRIGGMDPAPLLKVQVDFEALVRTNVGKRSERNAERFKERILATDTSCFVDFRQQKTSRVICYLAVRIRQITQYAAVATADIDHGFCGACVFEVVMLLWA